MKTVNYINEIAERLSTADRPEGFPALFVALLRELAEGSPVSREALATALGWTPDRVGEVLEQIPGAEYDHDGNLVGYGLTLRETSHVFEVDGSRLFTWCALDTLIFPALIDKAARILSRCPVTGESISLTVAPDEIRHLEPPEAVMSLVVPEASSDIRGSFCCHVHFFASASAADDWLTRHEGADIISVTEAFILGQGIARKLLEGANPRPS